MRRGRKESLVFAISFHSAHTSIAMKMPVLRAVEDGNRTMRAADDVAGFRKWLMSTDAAMPSYNIR
jgi:hypothetical protein